MREYIWDNVGRFLQLHGEGQRLTAICPFHREETPSFVVDQERNTYHCFGCEAHGCVEDFCSELERFKAGSNA